MAGLRHAVLLATFVLAGCFSSDDKDPSPGDVAEAGGALPANETAGVLFPAIDPFAGASELVLMDDEVVATAPCFGPVNQAIITAQQAESDRNVAYGCVFFQLPKGILLPEGTKRLRIEADATGALRSGAYVSCIYNPARTEHNSAPSRNPVQAWTFDVVPGEWDGPWASRSGSEFCFWPGGADGLNHLEGSIATRIVAERDPDWTPQPILDPWLMADAPATMAEGYLTILDEAFTWTKAATWKVEEALGQTYWFVQDVTRPIPLGTGALLLGVSWTVDGCQVAKECDVQYGLGRQDYSFYHWMTATDSDGGTSGAGTGHLFKAFGLDDFEPEGPNAEPSAWFTEVDVGSCNDQPGAGCPPPRDHLVKGRLLLEAWRSTPDLEGFPARLGVES